MQRTNHKGKSDEINDIARWRKDKEAHDFFHTNANSKKFTKLHCLVQKPVFHELDKAVVLAAMPK